MSVPLQLEIPPTSSVALSVTSTPAEPVPIWTSGRDVPSPESVRAVPLPSAGVVVSSELHDSNRPSVKSFCAAVSDGEERVSAMKLEKQPSRPRAPRSMPPSMKPPP